jgi:hypothetical protein
MTLDARDVGRLVTRVQQAFLDEPPLTLTVAAAQTRFAIDRPTCTAVLELLADAEVLVRTAAGAYTRFWPMAADRSPFSGRPRVAPWHKVA